VRRLLGAVCPSPMAQTPDKWEIKMEHNARSRVLYHRALSSLQMLRSAISLAL
jgi:hypothetical protein